MADTPFIKGFPTSKNPFAGSSLGNPFAENILPVYENPLKE
jgi:hypothetical protein